MANRHKIKNDGLSASDRRAVNRIASDLGYADLNELVVENGCSSAKDLVSDFNFTNVRDFFCGYGWHERLEPFRRNGTSKSALQVASEKA